MSHTSYNWIHYIAKAARKRETDYALVIRGLETGVAEGPDVGELLKGNVQGCTLYTFCEPNTEVRAQAVAAGIKAIYSAISRHDVACLIQAGYTHFKPVVLVDTRDRVLRPIKSQRAREEVLGQWALVRTSKGEPALPWLREVAEVAQRLRSDYAILVRDGLVLRGDPDVSALLADANGCILVAFCEPDARVLARAGAAGVTAVHCVLSRQDALKINLFGLGLKPIKNQTVRQEVLAQWRMNDVR